VLAALLVAAACLTPTASADLLTNTWFKLTLAARGRTLDTNNVTVKRLNVTRTVYLNITTNVPVGNLNNYQLRLWTKVDGVWSNSFNTTRNTIGANENFISDLFMSFRSSSNSVFSGFHTAFLNNKTNSSGRLRSTSYSGGGEVIGGDLNGKRYFGTYSLTGPQTSPSRLPFTP
jgi:hypothetical protein